MTKFKAGDYVEMLTDCSSVSKGEIIRLKKGPDGRLWAGEEYSRQGSGCSCTHKWKFIKKAVKFKAGDRVAVIECGFIKQYGGWREAVDKIYTLKDYEASELSNGNSTPLGDNEYMVNFSPESLEIIGGRKK